MNNCKPVPLGVAIGILWALSVASLGITAMFGWGGGFIAPLSSLYIGYSASIGGAIVGGLWAFADGFIAGVIIAWIYNALAK